MKTDLSVEVKTDLTGEVKIDLTGEVKIDLTGEVKTDLAGEVKTDSAGEVKTYLAGEVKTDLAGEVKTYLSVEENCYMIDFPRNKNLKVCAIHTLDTVGRVCNTLQRVKSFAKLGSYNVWPNPFGVQFPSLPLFPKKIFLNHLGASLKN